MTVHLLERLREDGFVEISLEEGMTEAKAYTAKCSGARSDCCTRTCTRNHDLDVGFATLDDWERFLRVEGGQIQY